MTVSTCALCNVTGAAAVDVPAGMSSHGLPIGVQLGAAVHREDLLLRPVTEFERADPWIERRRRSHVANLVTTARPDRASA